MSSLSVRKTKDDDEPVLMLDGEPLLPDARVTLAASEIALFAYEHTRQSYAAGMQATQKLSMDALVEQLQSKAPNCHDCGMPRRRSVERDHEGRIVAIIDEPIQ